MNQLAHYINTTKQPTIKRCVYVLFWPYSAEGSYIKYSFVVNCYMNLNSNNARANHLRTRQTSFSKLWTLTGTELYCLLIWPIFKVTWSSIWTWWGGYSEGILPKGSYPPCLRMADWALLTGYPRYQVMASRCFALIRVLFIKLDNTIGLAWKDNPINGCTWLFWGPLGYFEIEQMAIITTF